MSVKTCDTKRQNYFAVFTLIRRPTPTLKMARRISLELPAHVSMMHSISATGRNLTDAAACGRTCQPLKWVSNFKDWYEH